MVNGLEKALTYWDLLGSPVNTGFAYCTDNFIEEPVWGIHRRTLVVRSFPDINSILMPVCSQVAMWPVTSGQQELHEY